MEVLVLPRVSAYLAHSTLVALALTIPGCQQLEPDARSPQSDHSEFEQVIRSREYRPSLVGGELQAPNRAHNLRTWFGPGGIRVHDRTALGSPKLVAIEVRAFGRRDWEREVGPGEVTSRGTRVELTRVSL